MKLLVLSIDGRGMGHLNRTTLLVRALHRQEPDLEVRFLVESPAYRMVEQAGFPVLKLPDPLHPVGRYALVGRRAELEADLMRPILSAWQPDAVMIDFVVDPALYEPIKEADCRLLLVVRKMPARAMAELAADPTTRLVDAFVLPHDRSEFVPGELPTGLLERCHFTGPLVRKLELDSIPELRERYGKGAGSFVLVTLGGGGWAQAAELAEAARAAVRTLKQDQPGLGALVVYGPLYDGELPVDEPGLASIRFEANLPELMAASDVVVCAAGYNSSRELLASGTPGVMVPLSNPGRDDQAERARGVERDGRALVAGLDAASLVRALGRILAGEGPAKRPPEPDRDDSRAGKLLKDLMSS